MRLLATILLTTAPTLAVAQTMPAPTVAPAKEKKICREEAPTGSIFPKRVCHTKTEWAAVDAVRADDKQRYRDHRGDVPPGL